MSEFFEEEEAPCRSLWVLLRPRVTVLWPLGLRSHGNCPAGRSQNQVINTLVRKHRGSAAGREDFDVRSVAKLKINFHLSFLSRSPERGKCAGRQGLREQETSDKWHISHIDDGGKKKDQIAKCFIFEIIHVTEVFSLFAPTWVRGWPSSWCSRSQFLSNCIFSEHQICLQKFRVDRGQSSSVWLAAFSPRQNLPEPASQAEV